jgi:hypothetical protein
MNTLNLDQFINAVKEQDSKKSSYEYTQLLSVEVIGYSISRTTVFKSADNYTGFTSLIIRKDKTEFQAHWNFSKSELFELIKNSQGVMISSDQGRSFRFNEPIKIKLSFGIIQKYDQFREEFIKNVPEGKFKVIPSKIIVSTVDGESSNPLENLEVSNSTFNTVDMDQVWKARRDAKQSRLISRSNFAVE